ncbi:hypothetical protein C7256_28960, partial [Enterocloster lavalensis]
MAVPEGYTALARIGYADKGNYAAGTTYMTGDVVYHNGSSYVARKDNLKGVTPTNGNDWKYLARGFAAETMADVQAKDTNGVLGTAGAQVVSQELIDAIADRVMTKLIAKSQIVNNLLATEVGNVLDATQGKALKDGLDRVNSDLTESKNEVLLYSGKIKYNDEISVPNLHKYKLFHLGDNQNELYGCDVGGVVGNVLEFNLSGQVSGRAVFSSIKFHIIKANTLKVIFNIQVNVTADNA